MVVDDLRAARKLDETHADAIIFGRLFKLSTSWIPNSYQREKLLTVRLPDIAFARSPETNS